MTSRLPILLILKMETPSPFAHELFAEQFLSINFENEPALVVIKYIIHELFVRG